MKTISYLYHIVFILTTAITGYSPAYGKVGTKVHIYVENLPTEIKNPFVTYNGLAADCTVEKGYSLVTIPKIRALKCFPTQVSILLSKTCLPPLVCLLSVSIKTVQYMIRPTE